MGLRSDAKLKHGFVCFNLAGFSWFHQRHRKDETRDYIAVSSISWCTDSSFSASKPRESIITSPCLQCCGTTHGSSSASEVMNEDNGAALVQLRCSWCFPGSPIAPEAMNKRHDNMVVLSRIHMYHASCSLPETMNKTTPSPPCSVPDGFIA